MQEPQNTMNGLEGHIVDKERNQQFYSCNMTEAKRPSLSHRCLACKQPAPPPGPKRLRPRDENRTTPARVHAMIGVG